jgi:hypothetical protein
MSRRVDPTRFEEDEEGWDQPRLGGQGFIGQPNGDPNRRRANVKNAYHGKGKRSRRNRDGWERFDD